MQFVISMLNLEVVSMSDNTQGIPKEWKVTELGDSAHFELIMGQSPPSSSYNEGGKGIPFMQGNAEFGVIYPKPSKCTTEPTKIAQKNDILISVRAPVGELNMADSRLCLGRGLGAIRVKEGDCWFYFYYFQTIKTKIQNMSKGSTFKAIDKDQVERITVPLPPLSEQQKIAEILTTVDDAIELERKRKAKLERVKKGLMDELLTGRTRVN